MFDPPSTMRTLIGGTEGNVFFRLARLLPFGAWETVPVLARAYAVRGEDGLGGTLAPIPLAAAAPWAAGPRGVEGGKLLNADGAPIVGRRERGPKFGLLVALLAIGDCVFEPGPDPPLELLCRAAAGGRCPFEPFEVCRERLPAAGGGSSSGEMSSPFARDLAAEMNESRWSAGVPSGIDGLVGSEWCTDELLDLRRELEGPRPISWGAAVETRDGRDA